MTQSKKNCTVKELLQFIAFVAGPINPATHNLSFNDKNLQPNPFEDYLAFQDKHRKEFLDTHNIHPAVQQIKDDGLFLEEYEQDEIEELLDLGNLEE